MTSSPHLPLISVVMASCNGEKFIAAQLDSILSQSYSNIEIVVSDDASEDATPAILKSFAEKDSRVKFFSNPVRLGLNENFSVACSRAAGEFIAISDQDDIWRENKLEKLLSLFRPDVMLCHGQSVRFSEKVPFEKRVYDKRILFRGQDARKLFYFNTIAGHNIMFRRKLLEKALPFPGEVYYDWWICMVAACHGNVEAATEVLTFHRFHSSNVTLGKKDEKFQTRAKAMERLEAARLFMEIPDMEKRAVRFGEKLLRRLQDLRTKSFSFRLFWFLLYHAPVIFFFKKSLIPLISHIKISYRLSWAR